MNVTVIGVKKVALWSSRTGSLLIVIQFDIFTKSGLQGRDFLGRCCLQTRMENLIKHTKSGNPKEALIVIITVAVCTGQVPDFGFISRGSLVNKALIAEFPSLRCE